MLGFETDLVQGAAAAMGAGAVTACGWLVGKLWKVLREETAALKTADSANASAIAKHVELDAQVHREMMGAIGELKGFISSLK